MVETAGRITLWGIEVFLAIAEERSISAAARRLGASNSSASQQLSNIETALGTRLIDRSARPLGLTPAGHLFRRRARVILDEIEQARTGLRIDAHRWFVEEQYGRSMDDPATEVEATLHSA